MKKGLKFVVLVLGIFILFINLQFVNADTNYALTGTPSHANQQAGANNYLIWTWQDAKLKDDLVSDVAHGVVVSNQARYSTWASFDSIINFPSAVAQLDKIEVVFGLYGGNQVAQFKAYVNTGAGWQQVGDTGSFAMPRTGTLSFTTGAPWNNVQGIKIYSYSLTTGMAYVDYRIFEIRAIGPGACIPESNAAFCDSWGGECEGFSGVDNCGTPRTVDCGDCVAPQTCQAGVCICALNCAGKECGNDGCGGSCPPGCVGEEVCNSDGVCVLPQEVFWANVNGDLITESSIGSTVWMIYKNKVGERYDFNVMEDDPADDDEITTILSSENFDHSLDLGAEWAITQADFDKGADTGELIDGQEEFRFIVDGAESEDLIVRAGNYNNTIPTTQITNPKYKDIYVINKTLNRTTNIYFNQISSDPDDDLKLTWQFGDGTGQFFENIKKTGLGDTSHVYTNPGTKSIKLTAEEMSPPRAASEIQSASDATEIYVYGEGVIVFAIITKPNPDEMQELTSRFVEINASATHVINCSYDKVKCQASAPGGICAVYNDTITKEGIWCYKFPQIEQDKIKMEWTFDGDASNKLIGDYSEKSKVVEFIKVFEEPGKHTLNLRASYTAP